MALLGQHDGLMTQPDPFLREGFGQSLKFFEAVMVLDKHRSSSSCDSDAEALAQSSTIRGTGARQISGLGIIDETADQLDVVIKRLHRRLTWARSTRADLTERKTRGQSGHEEEQLLRHATSSSTRFSLVTARPTLSQCWL